ncbi:hypothetical protein MAPG_05292 [Magnaporthiopsis poae ATCC 64411]|uniref:Uncharacterized protein n=1 Tax=Magnaporthiopsis poae (strain ATCC 64411 / 73-15) TaxID=644358 RepID=A0A0C4DZ05_MAGP6|nr:hypothetical protein MAPG_05292 [Magnaporthiopsis poae ATCC 64411]
MDSQANEDKSLLDVIKEVAHRGSSEGIQRAPKNKDDYASEDTSLGQPQGTVAPAVTPVAQPTSPARDEEDSDSSGKPAGSATEYHKWGAGDDDDSDDGHSNGHAAAASSPSKGTFNAGGANTLHGDAAFNTSLAGSTPPPAPPPAAGASFFCPGMTTAEGQPQQGRRRTSMFAKIPYQQPPASAAGEDEITDLGGDHGIDNIQLQTRRKSETGQPTGATSDPGAASANTDGGV